MAFVPVFVTLVPFVSTGDDFPSALGAADGTVTAAQAQRPRAEVTPVVQTAPIKAGQPARVSLKVTMPKDVHVQANKPRDALLIPTVLSLDPPAGVSVVEVVYPTPTELAQAGRADKLLVLGPEFSIEVRLAVAPGAGASIVLPGVLRYQACNDTLCFPPTRATTEWALTVAP
jgi:DsbC/DsbD-like thiol-disulfide interchange protein